MRRIRLRLAAADLGVSLAAPTLMRRAIIAVWMATGVTLVAAAIEFYDVRILSGAGMLVVSVGLGALAVFLRDRYG